MSTVLASYYYQEILNQLLRVNFPIHERCKSGYLLFQEFLREETSDAGVYLSGTFSKLHYLFQESKASDEQIYVGLNDYRVRMEGLSGANENVLQADFPYDMLRLARMVSWRTKVQIPVQLKDRLPQLLPEVRRRKGRFVGDFRVVVLEKHEDYLLVFCVNEGMEQKVRLRSTTDDKNDFTALLPFLEKDSNLNLVDTRWVDEALEPTLIVLEPDYLIPVTTVANCFQATGVCSQYDVVNRLQPVPVTSAILLGHLAGQMLDEELHGYESSYPDTARRFFAQNAVQCYTCTELASNEGRRDFHINAQSQQLHLRSMVQHQLRNDLHLNALSDVLLEPTFFCELLGLQGRMDLLSRDFTTVIEQKSGKMDEWTRRAQLSHNIQLQLYRAILHFNHKVRFNDMRAYLLYSKYSPEYGLMRIETIMDYLREALQIRNEIVARELLFSTEGIADYLNHFDIDSFTDGRASKLWSSYKRPALESFIGVYRQSSELARSYFNRFHRFLSLERRLGMVGNQQRECSGFASAWNATFEEKQEVGDIIASLSFAEPGGCVCNEDGAVESLCLKLPQTENQLIIAPNFREGDIVVLYSYDQHFAPDMRKGLVFRATIIAISSEKIILQLRAPQTNSVVFDTRPGRLWAIEKDFMDSASTSLFRGLFSFLSGSEHRREVLLNPSLSLVDDTQVLVLDHQDDERNMMVLKAKQARDFFLLVGPPGTGKTSFGLMSILREELTSGVDCNVLLAAYTNRAVDEICSKLAKDEIDFLRMGNKHNCDPLYHQYLLEHKVSQLSDVNKVGELIRSTRILVGTVASLSGMTALLMRKRFSLAIVDEASQLLEPHLLPLLMAGENEKLAIRRFVLIGDHKQLPAVVQQTPQDSRVSEEELKTIGLDDCRKSLFERLYHSVPKCCIHEFTKQGRMHPEVAEFANKQFYNGQLQDCGLQHQVLAIPQPRVLFYTCTPSSDSDLLSVTSRKSCPKNSDTKTLQAGIPSAKLNLDEAQLIVHLAEHIYKEIQHRGVPFDLDKELGIIVPYRHQITMVRSLLQTSAYPVLANVTIDTVERFQGSEKNVIIYGFTVSRPSQLSFLCDSQFIDQQGLLIDRKLNVALTRARERTLLVGNPEILESVPLFAKLIAEVPRGDIGKLKT